MPQVVAAAAIAGAISASTALPWLAAGAFFEAFATSLVLGGLSMALAPKPKKPSFNQIDAQTFAVRQPDEPRKHIFGLTRVADVFAHMETTGENEKLHVFLVLADDKLSGLVEVWVNDYVIPSDWISDDDGMVTEGRYKDKLRIRFHNGDPNQEADELAVAELAGWTEDHRGRGVAYLYLTLYKDRDVYPSGMPNISGVCFGPEKLDPRDSTYKFTMNMALGFYDFLAQLPDGFNAGDTNVSLTNIAANANICDEIVDTKPVDQELDNSIEIDSSTDTNILTLEGDRVKFEHGDRVEIVTAGTPPAGTATGTPYYVIIFQTKDTPRIKLASSLANAMARVSIDITDFGTGDITIRKTGEPRYHGAGVINTADDLGDTLNAFLMGMAGRAVCAGGYWQLYAGAWRAPSMVLTLSDMRGQMSYRRPVPMSEKFNVIKGKYISPLNNYQPTDFPVAKFDTFIEQDLVEYPPRDINLPFTTRATTCQRIANIELFKSRQDIVFTAPFTERALLVQAGSTAALTIDELGWEEKAFDVTEFSLGTSQGEGAPILICDLTLRETAEEIYTWNEDSDVSIDPAPNTNLPNPFFVQVPTGVGYNSVAVDTAAADTLWQLSLQWNQHPDAFVREGGLIEIRYKKTGETEYRPSFFVDGALTNSVVVASSPNETYDLAIRAVNRLGVTSAWVYILNAVVGTSGGVGVTDDWKTYSDVVTISKDWGSFSAPVTATEDWGYFT